MTYAGQPENEIAFAEEKRHLSGLIRKKFFEEDEMRTDVSKEEKNYAQEILELRLAGKTNEAVSLCDNAIHVYKDNNFFYKVKGDILFSQSLYQDALNCYLNYLDKIKLMPQYFTNFSKFMYKLQRYYQINEGIYEGILDIARSEECADIIRNGVLKIVCDCWDASPDVLKILNQINLDYSENTLKESLAVLERKSECDKLIFLNGIDISNCTRRNYKLNRKILTMLENAHMYEKAIEWANTILLYSKDGVVIRSLFRICRLKQDYSAVSEFINQKHKTYWNDFNVLYELVLFYEFQEDEIERNSVLEKIRRDYSNSIPILHTLFKFYLKYDMLEDARIIQDRINDLKKQRKESKTVQKKYEEAVLKNQDIIWKRLAELIKETEHNRQLLAMTELIKGFSHELGQPLTNIRYSIQLFFMKQRKNKTPLAPDEQELLDGILLQTQRIGKLLSRFAPIVSSRSIKEFFNVYDEIASIFDEFNMRLHNENIEYEVKGSKNCLLYGEKLQFSQIFYNLIINSIYAIRKKNIKGKICVDIQNTLKGITIRFSDNGVGIPKEFHRKIFNPFFSTKKKEIDEGGEGLGLYIVWNILKMYNGTISINDAYFGGAMFIMNIKMEEKENV